MPQPIRTIAVIGTGVIGASWTALFLAKGLKVVATDIADNAEASLNRFVDAAWPMLERLGLAPDASRSKLTFAPGLEETVADADFVQENGPERLDLKQDLYRRLDGLLPPDVIIASSSSGLKMSEIQSACLSHPERCVIGHPFNPPHLVPLVEVVGGAMTAPQAVRQAMSFYSSIGKRPVHLRREVVGHVANRLQAALQREMIYLIAQGVVDVADVDTVISWGPGLRWGIMGPNLLLHLAGGPGGIKHTLKHLGPAMSAWWRDLGALTELTPAVEQLLIEGALKAAGDCSVEELSQERDELLLRLLLLRSEREHPACSGSTRINAPQA